MSETRYWLKTIILLRMLDYDVRHFLFNYIYFFYVQFYAVICFSHCMDIAYNLSWLHPFIVTIYQFKQLVMKNIQFIYNNLIL